MLAPVILAGLGDTRRFSSSRQAVRFAGLDVTVSDSDGKGPPGRLSRQGSSVLRWALYEAAGSAWRAGSPDHEYYLSVKERLDSRRARLSVARRMLRRISHHLAESVTPPSLLFADIADARRGLYRDGLFGQLPLSACLPPSRWTSPLRMSGRPLREPGYPTTHHVAGTLIPST